VTCTKPLRSIVRDSVIVLTELNTKERIINVHSAEKILTVKSDVVRT